MSFRTILFSTASAMAASLVIAGPAAAQDEAQAAPADTIIVNGFLKSLSLARDAKREANIVKDVIVAEDMAKFPELNLAESLQRIPGVAINREAGEGRQVTLRGLGPDYTRVQLNGMEVLGNVDSAMDSRGQRSRDRAFDFNIFASELFSRVEVEKTYQASQNEGGMAGTLGLFTAKPLDYQTGLKGALSGKLGTNTYTKDAQPRLAAMAGYNFDNTFGILVSVAWSKRKTQEQGYNTYTPNQRTAAQMQTYLNNGLDISALTADEQAKFTSGDLYFATGNRISVWEAEQERLGITLATQWRPADNLLLTVDGLYGEFTTHRDEYHLATRPTSPEIAFNGAYTDFGNPIQASRINAIRWDDSDFVNYIDVDNATYGSEHRRQLNKNKFRQIALTGDWEASDTLRFDGHVGYEKSDYDTPIDDKLYLQAQGGMVTEYAVDGRSATNDYRWDTTNPGNYRIRELYFRENSQSTTLKEASLNGHLAVSKAVTLNAGYAYRRYENTGWERFNDGLYADEFRGTPGYDEVTPYATVLTSYKGQDWVVGDWEKMLAYYGKSHTMVGAKYKTKNTYGITEETNAGYVQMDWNTDLFGVPFRGNAGVRSYWTTTVNTGLVTDANGGLVEDTISNSYSGLLPAFNGAFEVTPDFLVRFAAAKNINRPALSSMKMTGSVKVANGEYTVSNGNPYLKPYTSLDLDFSAEWYFGKVGMVSLGVFHKSIDDLVSSETLYDVPYSVTGLSTALADGLTPDTNITQYSRSINVAKAHITGLEMAAQSNFTFLPAPFDNLGAVVNLTLLDSNAKYNGLDGPITGLSDTNANATIYYETGKWGLRASANYRSGYLRTRYDGSKDTSEDGFHGTVYVDAAAFVNLWDGFRLTLDAINITNETEVQFNSIYNRLHNETQSGTTILAGFNVTF